MQHRHLPNPLTEAVPIIHPPTQQQSTHRKLLEQLWGSTRGKYKEGALTQFRVPHVVKPQQLVVVAILVIDLGSMAGDSGLA